MCLIRKAAKSLNNIVVVPVVVYVVVVVKRARIMANELGKALAPRRG